MPRGRGRGRGGRGIRGGRFSKPAAPLLRKSMRTASNLSESNQTNSDAQAGVYATWDPAASLFTIHGLTDEDFERWEQDEETEIDTHTLNSVEAPSFEKSVLEEDLNEDYLREPPPKAVLSQYEELEISRPRRGFYAPPPVKVWRKKNKELAENGESDGVIDPLDDHESEKQDLDLVSEGDFGEQIAAPDIVVSAEGIPKHLQIEDAIEEEAPSDHRDPPEMIDEGELSDSELPPPFLDRPPTPDEADCDDAADFILRTRFAPISDPQAFVKALTKYPPASRDTKVLYELALNTQRALKEWQDEYLMLDARTAPHSNPPKKAVTGGRYPIDPTVYEDMKEADLYGYNFDPKRETGLQDPFAQRPGGSESIGGRELRQRRARELGEEPSDDEGTGTEVGKRKRKAVIRYDGEPRSMRGRKRAFDSEPPEPEGPPRKRGRPSAADKAAQMHLNIRRLREESTVASTISESESISPGPPRRRGRPPGSKNLQPRSDAGIKKGPRKGKLSYSVEPESLQTEDDLAPIPANNSQVRISISGNLEDPFVESRPQSHTLQEDDVARSGGASTPATDAASQGPLNKRKQRVKSEKRSQSMTEWWAARKAKQLEERKKQQAELEKQRLAEQQTAEQNNFHNRFWTNDTTSQKIIRSGGPAIAPAPQQGSQPSPITSHFIISGPQQKPGHERKRSSPLKHEHVRTLSKDLQEIPPPQNFHPYSPPVRPPGYPPPPPAMQAAQQPQSNPFGLQLSPLASLTNFRHSSIPGLPPPAQSYSGPTQTSLMAGQGPPPPHNRPNWSHHPYPPPPSYQPPTQQPPYIPPPQSSSHPPPLAPAAPLPPFSLPPQHGPQLQPLQPAPPTLGQLSPPVTTSRGPPEHWTREWPRARPSLGPPFPISAPMYDHEHEEMRAQEQRHPHEFIHSHGLIRPAEKPDSRDRE